MSKRPSSLRAPIGRRLLALAVAGVVVMFAIEGGEWGTFDLLAQRQRMQRLGVEVDSLQHLVDSLKAYRKRLDTDPRLQERIAREEFGMVRGSKEILYRFTTPATPAPRP